MHEFADCQACAGWRSEAPAGPLVSLGRSGLPAERVVRKNPERSDQDSLSVLLSNRLARPALAQGPLPHAHPFSENVPHAAAGRAFGPTQYIQSALEPPSRLEMSFRRP